MLKIRKKRLENLLGNRFLAPLKQNLRFFAHRRREKRMRDILATTYSEPTPLFCHIQVETCSFCNNDCHFCPASTAVDTRPKHFMSWDVIFEITKQLKSVKYNGLVSLYNNNDPLIDKRIADIIRHFKKELPDTKIEIYTNGILLNMKVAKELWDAGLDSLMVDHYYTKTKRNRKIEVFLEEYKKSPYALAHNVTVNEINKEIIRSSRGGEAPNKKKANARGFCAYPFTQFNVNYKGDIYLCCNDVYYQKVFGNISERHILEIWDSPKYQAVRKRLLQEDRNFGICKNCDAQYIFKGAKEIVHQIDNNQIVIPGCINNEQRINYRSPAKIYPFK